MVRVHRVYLAYPSFLRHPRRQSSHPIASNSLNRISTTAVAVMPAAMYIVGPFLFRSTVLLRHRGRRGRCAHDDRVQSAPVGCPSLASSSPVKLITTQRSDPRLPTSAFEDHPFITLSIYFLYQFGASRGWINTAPLVLNHTLFLAQNYYNASMHTRILQTRSSVAITVVTVNTSSTFSLSVCFFASAPAFFTAIRQSKPYQ